MSGAPTRSAVRGLTPTLVFVVAVVAVLSSLGAPLVPAVAATYGVGLPDAQWSLTVTLVVGAVATPVLGRLADGPHQRVVTLGVLALVVVGSVLAALPLSLGWLLAGRGLQGVGMGLTPVAMAIARASLPGAPQRAALAALSVTVVAGLGLGYPVAGLIADLGGIHAAFWFGAAVSGLALLAGALVLPPSPAAPARRLDVPGALLLGTGLAAGLLVVGEGGTWGWTSPRILALGGLSLVALAGWVGWALRSPTPLVDLRLAGDRTAGTAHLTSLLVGSCSYLMLASVTVLVQTPTSSGYGFGASIVVAGLLLAPFSVASVVGSRLARLGERTGPHVVLPVGALLVSAASASLALTPPDLWLLGGAMAVTGLGVGGCFAALPALVVSAVPPGETGSAMSLNQVLRYVGFATGSAATAAVLEASTPAGSAVPAVGAYTVLGLAGCGLGLVTAVVAWLLPARHRAGAG